MQAIGIDLAGVESRPTGFCRMDSTLQTRTLLLYTDDEIISETIKYKPDAVAIDAPLSLPLGRESLEKRSSIHLRECDRELLRTGIKFFPLTIGPMRQLTTRGIRIKAELESKGMMVVETYPGAAQDILGISRKGKGLDRLEQGLNLVGIKGLNPGMNGDELDAVTCALVGIMYLKGEYQAIGNPDEILMILPQWQHAREPRTTSA